MRRNCEISSKKTWIKCVVTSRKYVGASETVNHPYRSAEIVHRTSPRRGCENNKNDGDYDNKRSSHIIYELI